MGNIINATRSCGKNKVAIKQGMVVLRSEGVVGVFFFQAEDGIRDLVQ